MWLVGKMFQITIAVIYWTLSRHGVKPLICYLQQPQEEWTAMTPRSPKGACSAQGHTAGRWCSQM